MNTTHSADILLMTTAPIESKAILDAAKNRTGQKPKPVTIGPRTYHDFGKINGSRVFLARCQQGAGGIAGSQEEARVAIEALKPGAVIMVGFAFGVDPKKQKIGDVLVSRQLSLYEPQRVGTNKQGEPQVLPRGDKVPASARLINWLESADLEQEDDAIRVKFGVMLTGEKLVDNLEYRNRLVEHEPEAIGGEMEGAGIYVACHNNHIDWVLVKAICDWADKKGQHKEEWQKKAAFTAAEFVIHALHHAKITPPERPKPANKETAPQGNTQASATLRDNSGNVIINNYHSGVGPTALTDEKLTPIKQTAVSMPSETSGTKNKIWNVPYRRNVFFTGRESLLNTLRNLLISHQRCALSGLPGIGKTQTALAYAIQHRESYAAVLWARANGREALLSSFVSIARALDLPVKDDSDQSLIISGVKAWLEREKNWLLIFDNADDIALLRSFLPEENHGHILLTTRASATGDTSPVSILKMDVDEGALFLLRRARILDLSGQLEDIEPEKIELAREISIEMDGLPLALDQAGAFIDEMKVSLSTYLDLFRAEGARLLEERGDLDGDHPSVTVTFTMAFQQVEASSHAAADLIRACAFLAPDDIPVELFSKGATELGDELSICSNNLELTRIIREAGRFSLIKRDPDTDTIDIHRLVQEVIKAEMESKERLTWSGRIVDALKISFPEKVEFSLWSRCERLTTHALVAADIVKEGGFKTANAGRLFGVVGSYVLERGQYKEAEELLELSLSIYKSIMGEDSTEIAEVLNVLGVVYLHQARYSLAKVTFSRSIDIRNANPESASSDLASTLGNFSAALMHLGDLDEAEKVALRALEIRRGQSEINHSDIANSLNSLSSLYQRTKRYEKAKSLIEEALEECKEDDFDVNPDVAFYNGNLAVILDDLGDLTGAEQMFQLALSMQQSILAPNHPTIGGTLHDLAIFYTRRKNSEQAEIRSLFKRALEIRERSLGSNHPDVASTLEQYAYFLRKTKRFSFQAAGFEKRAKSIRARHRRENTSEIVKTQ